MQLVDFGGEKHPNNRFGHFLCPSKAKWKSEVSISDCTLKYCDKMLKFCTSTLLSMKNLMMAIIFPNFQNLIHFGACWDYLGVKSVISSLSY